MNCCDARRWLSVAVRMIHLRHDGRGRHASRRSRDAEGDAAGGAGARRAAGADRQGTAAPSLRPPGREAAGRPAPAGARGGRARRGQWRGGGRRCRPERAHQARRQAPGEPGLPAGPSAAGRDGGRYRRPCLPVLPQRAAPDRRGRQRAAGHRSGPAPGRGGPPAQVRLPGLRGGRGAGAGAGQADRGRAADRRDRGPGSGLQVRRPSAALPAVPDLRPPGRQSGPLHLGRLGRPGGLHPAAGLRAACSPP